MPDGTLIQWGMKNTWDDNSMEITFPVSYYGLPVVAQSVGAGTVRVPVWIEDVTSTGFNAVRLDGALSAVWIRWIAIGRWKA